MNRSFCGNPISRVEILIQQRSYEYVCIFVDLASSWKIREKRKIVVGKESCPFTFFVDENSVLSREAYSLIIQIIQTGLSFGLGIKYALLLSLNISKILILVRYIILWILYKTSPIYFLFVKCSFFFH